MLILPNEIEFILKTLQNNGFEAYIVGGCVRDVLMGIAPHDYDITTSSPPEVTASIFDKTIPTGIKHGTVTVISGNYAVEVTTYRADGEYSDHRKPDNVTFVKSLTEDLARRDFTVNAICYNNDGLIDYFGGIKDIENKILRAVGEPEKRFTEDALRILRLFRFASVLEFEIDSKTLNAAIKTADSLKNISAERIAVELKKALGGKNPKALSYLTDINTFSFLKIIEKPDYQKIKNADSKLKLFTFLYSANADIIKTMELLRLSNKEKEFAENLIMLLNIPYPQSKTEIKEMLFKTGHNIFKAYLSFQKNYFNKDITNAEEMLLEITNNNEPYKISDLNITGKDLSELEIYGKEIGKALEYLRQLVIDNPKHNQKKILIQKVLEFKGN